MNASMGTTSMGCSPATPGVERRGALRRFAAAALLAVAAAAGAAGPARAEAVLPPAPLLPELALDVAEIHVVPAYAPPPGSAETTIPFAPVTALEAWAKTHVRAVGRRGQAWIVIRDASITAQRVKPVVHSWRDWFRRQPVERYDAVLELELQIRDDVGTIRAQAAARATHSRFLMEDYRDYHSERIAELQRLTDEVIAAALRRLADEVHANLARWVR
jgi:hypothetical protein